MMLHPKYKRLDLFNSNVDFCNTANGVGTDVCTAIKDELVGILRCKLTSLTMSFAGPTRVVGLATDGNAYSEETGKICQL
jgi:hypothetical protein